MTAIARLRTAVEPREVCEAYDDCVREYRENMRLTWLRQEIKRIKDRIHTIDVMKFEARKYGWSVAYLNRESLAQKRLLCERRAELERMRGAV